MRRFLQFASCSVATLVGLACSSTNITQSGGHESTAGSSNHPGGSSSGGTSTSRTGIGGPGGAGASNAVAGSTSLAGSIATGGNATAGASSSVSTGTIGGQSTMGGTSATIGGSSSTIAAAGHFGEGGNAAIAGASSLGGAVATGGTTQNGGSVAMAGAGPTVGGAATTGGTAATGGTTAVDYCNPNPCQHSGVCTNGVGKFTCRCSGGYGDLKCDNAVYTALATPANLSDCLVKSVSADGKVAVGQCKKSTDVNQAVKWDTSTGAPSLLLPYSLSAYAMGVNSNGSLVVGDSMLDTVNSGGVVWTTPSATPKIITQAMHIEAVSANGKIAVGTTSDGAGVYWDVSNIQTSGTSPVVLIASGRANGVSSDGSVIVGDASAARDSTAVRWTAATGAVSLAHYHLCYDSTGPCAVSHASGISGDGNVTFGGSNNLSINMAVRWVGTDPPQLLGMGPNNEGATPLGSNVDGSIIIGSIGGTDAMIWDSKNGMQSLTGVLATIGVALPTAPTLEATGISHDGTIVVGNSYDTAISNTSIPWAVHLTNTGVADL